MSSSNRDVLLARVVFVVGGALSVLFWGGGLVFIVGSYILYPQMREVLHIVTFAFLAMAGVFVLPRLIEWAHGVLKHQGQGK